VCVVIFREVNVSIECASRENVMDVDLSDKTQYMFAFGGGASLNICLAVSLQLQLDKVDTVKYINTDFNKAPFIELYKKHERQ
jgi:alcohol dehydrogenase class IV